MKKLDVYLQNARMSKAVKFIRTGDCVLDIGTYNGALFRRYHKRMSKGVGIDPLLTTFTEQENYKLIPGYFPAVCPDIKFDVITLLAVMEHIQPKEQVELIQNSIPFLNKGGRVIITVPSPIVDHILALLTTLKILDGMELHEHYKFTPEDTLNIFPSTDFKLVHRKKFQFGLNNLFVFEKISS